MLSTLKIEREKLQHEAEEFSAEKARLQSILSEEKNLLGELANLGTKESEAMQSWIACGRQGERPRPLDSRRSEILNRIAEIEVPKKLGHDFAYYEREEQELLKKLAANAEAFEMEVIRLVTVEIKSAFSEVEKFKKAAAAIEGGREFLLQQGQLYLTQRRGSLHAAALRAANESLKSISQEVLALTPAVVASEAAHWRDRANELRA